MSFLEDAFEDAFDLVDTGGGILPSGTKSLGSLTGEAGAEAAAQAAQLQAQGVTSGIAEQRRQFDITQQQLEPSRELGLSALRQQASLAGLDVPAQTFARFGDPGGVGGLGAAGEQEVDITGGRIIQGAGGIPVRRGRAGAPGELPAIEGAAPLDPFGFDRQGPGETFQFEQGPTGEFQLPQADLAPLGADFQETAGQTFLRERAERSLLRNAAATGQLGGGATRQALQEQAIGLGQQFLGEQETQRRARQQDEFNRLLSQEQVRQQRQGIAGGQLTTEEAIRSQREAVGFGVTADEESIRRQREIDAFNRLSAVSGAGQLSQGQLGAASQATTAAISGAQGQLGAIAGQGILGAQQAQSQGIQNTAGLGVSLLGFLAASDRRLKRNIKFKGMTPGGNRWYSFDYLWGDSSEGVMADEVDPSFVVRDSSGFDMVNYARIT